MRGADLLPLLTVLGVTSCTGPQGNSTAPRPTGSAAFQRQVAPFPVAGEDGVPYDHPFLGGLEVPRPQFHDIDGDGDLDLFVQELTGELTFFENVGTPSSARFVWRTDRFGDLDVGEWNRFVDLDRDGDLDLLTERPFSYVRYYRNEGGPTTPRFGLATDTVRLADGSPIFADRQNIPNLTDIDCDGRWDLFLGRVDGTVAHYAEALVDEQGVPRFRLVTDRFEDIEIVAQIGSAHGANSMSFADADSDGDQDLFWGDFFEPGVLFIENVGTCEEPNLTTEPIPLPVEDALSTSGYNVTAFADIDGDSDQDLFVGVLGGAFNPNLSSIDNFLFLERLDSGLWRTRTRRFLTMLDAGSESVPSLVDLDGDGDLDLLVANKIDPEDLTTSTVRVFLNEGGARDPRYRHSDTWDLLRTYHQVPAFADLDADGDQDMLVGTWNRGVAFYRNEGSRKAADFVLVDSATITLTRGSNATPALADVDGDGDLDLFVGESSGELNFYRNVGGPLEPRFELVTDRFGDIDVGQRSFPAFVDWDGDGDLDLMLGREEGGVLFYRSEGQAVDPVFSLDRSVQLPLPRFSVPAFGDVDGDGDLDVLSGGRAGGIVFLRNQRPSGR